MENFFLYIYLNFFFIITSTHKYEHFATSNVKQYKNASVTIKDDQGYY